MAQAILIMIWIILRVSTDFLTEVHHGEVITTLTLMVDGTAITACL